VIPNAIDNKIFRLFDKHKCRKQFGISKDTFIVAFVGWFSERKGSRRVARALSLVNKVKPVYSFFIGEGTEDPVCPNILYKGKVKHDEIPIYLNAADVFVLPTQHEGCCNAIIEAMACGLPIISSDLPFNYDVLNHHNSILINPNNVENIKTAIMSLVMDEKLKNELSKGALETSSHLSITDRAITIISFFNRSTAI
jgi:glycosyltransferase involved in cell wall biosynthesis